MACLRKSFGEVEDLLEDVPGGRITGVVVSPAFQRLDFKARQKKLADALQKGLTAQDLAKVGVIAALTPREASLNAA